MRRRPLRSALFPYTTLFRSLGTGRLGLPGGPAAASVLPEFCSPADDPKLPRPSEPGTYCRPGRSEEHTSELQSRVDLVCRLLLEKKKGSAEAALQRQSVTPR